MKEKTETKEVLTTTTIDELRKRKYEDRTKSLISISSYVDGKQVIDMTDADSFPYKKENYNCRCEYLGNFMGLVLDPLKSFFSTMGYMESETPVEELWYIGATLEKTARKELLEVVDAIEKHLGRIGILKISEPYLNGPSEDEAVAVRLIHYQ